MDQFGYRFLKVLGLKKRSPSEEALKEIVRVHISRIPFENISKLYYKKHLELQELPEFGLYLDGIERYHFGGTCYANNYYLNRLLTWLGYEVKLCGADMAERDVHVVNVVRIVNDVNSVSGMKNVDNGGRNYLVDAGYAAPFREPLPLDHSSDLVINSGRNRYVLKPFDSKTSRHPMEVYRDGILRHGYRINPAPKKIEDFQAVIAHSFREESTFLNSILVTRFDGDRFISIRNLSITESTPGELEERILESKKELAGVIEQRIGIPAEIILESISWIDLL